MFALHRHAYRIVWANPRVAAPGFAPLAGGMAAALPYVDSFISGHSADALTEVVRELGTTRLRAGGSVIGGGTVAARASAVGPHHLPGAQPP